MFKLDAFGSQIKVNKGKCTLTSPGFWVKEHRVLSPKEWICVHSTTDQLCEGW